MCCFQMNKYSKWWAPFTIIIYFILHPVTKGHVHQNNPMLLYSTTKDIRIVNTTRTNNKVKINTITLLRNLTDGAAIDFHYSDKKICWTDHGLESIQCVTYNGGMETENKIEIVSSGVMSPDGLACDWFTNKLYWTDSDTNRIEVATMTGQHRKVLFWSDLDQPRAIALAPMKGLMFWTDWGELPKIERAGMNGDPSTRKVIVSENIFWPNGLSIDYEEELIYWIDGKLLFIDVMDYNGGHRSTVLDSGFIYPFALTQFHNKLYWTDWKTCSIYVYDRNSTAREPKELINLSELFPMDIHVWDPIRQPQMYHPCQKNNGGCSHLCLLSPNPPGYSCACPIGIKLIDNLTCADGPQELLILARRTDICVIYLDSGDYTTKVLPLSNVKYTIAVDYDPIEGFIYWTDDEVKKIQRAKLDGSDQEDVITSEIKHPDGIAVDWISRNIYWTDTGTDRIEVARIEGRYRKVIISEGLIEPRAIAVAPEIGWMFWSDWNEKSPKIERSNLDGSERKLLVSSDLGWPNGVTLDLENFKIYWCDARHDKIEYANMDGTDRRELINDHVPHVFGFSLMGDYLYWTDWQRRAIDRAHKDSGSHREVIVDQMANVMGLKAVHLGQKSGTNPCAVNNGNCSHICLYRHNNTRVCACQIDYELTKDGQKCVVPEAFLIYSSKTNIGRISIENENNAMMIPITGIKNASSIDYDVNNMRLYWSDSKLRTIMRAFINGSDPQRVIELGLASPEGIAVDWLAHNIYWADPATNRIEVSRLGGSSRRTLLWENVDEPHSIVLDPREGYMYWSEWGRSMSIKKAAMDGSGMIKLLTTVGRVTGLVLDYKKRRLYWSEINPSSIVSSDLNGFDKRILANEHIVKPTALTLYKDFVYWNDDETGGISRAHKVTGLNYSKIHSLPEGATDVLIFNASKQTGVNQCAADNGGCTHLCLALPAPNHAESVTYTCACPTHYTLEDKVCVPPKRFMIYSQRNLAVRLLPDTSDCSEAELPIQGLKAIKAIDFDPVHNFLYWIEGKSNSIKKAEATGIHMSVVIQANQGYHPFDIAVDAIGRLLFWTCGIQNVINVTRLDNSLSVGVIMKREGEKPRLLAIHPSKRLLFYTDVGDTPQLVRTRLDGSHRIVITKTSDIAAIAVDAENDLLVWAKGHDIHISNIDGDNQHLGLNDSNSRISQLTVHSGWVYWLDRDIQQLHTLELNSGSRSYILTHASHISDLVSVTQPDPNHPCSPTHAKRCSHICILNGTSAVCACPQGLALQEDKKTCSAVPNCGSDHFTCSVQAPSKDCIPVTWRCDGQKDCTDGSDEAGCPSCKPDEFRCQNGQCINQALVCDGVAHCTDKYDEAHCCKNPDDFQCPRTEVCISKYNVCNGIDDCADGADEQKSLCIDPNKYMAVAKRGPSVAVIIIFVIIFFAVIAFMVFCFLKKRFFTNNVHHDQSEDPLSPMQTRNQIKSVKKHKGIQDAVHMSMLNGSLSSSYDRNHITGASSSTNGSSLLCYPQETLNPPPSPATTAASTRGSSPSSRYRPYRHYRSINQPPPPTPCSTDVCDESDYNYPTVRVRYDAGPIPPPPTPRSHCHSESCPPSPSSRSSTYFSPLPPPPSPVASPLRGYDS